MSWEKITRAAAALVEKRTAAEVMKFKKPAPILWYVQYSGTAYIQVAFFMALYMRCDVARTFFDVRHGCD